VLKSGLRIELSGASSIMGRVNRLLIVCNHVDMLVVDVIGSDSRFISLGERNGREGRSSSAEKEKVVIVDVPG